MPVAVGEHRAAGVVMIPPGTVTLGQWTSTSQLRRSQVMHGLGRWPKAISNSHQNTALE